MDAKIAAFEIEQATRPAEIVEQMTIDVEKIGIIANFGDDVLVPDFGQQRTSGLFQGMSSLLALWPAASTANHRFARLIFEPQVVHQSITGSGSARAKPERSALVDTATRSDHLESSFSHGIRSRGRAQMPCKNKKNARWPSGHRAKAALLGKSDAVICLSARGAGSNPQSIVALTH
jgi:hypothetical protein